MATRPDATGVTDDALRGIGVGHGVVAARVVWMARTPTPDLDSAAEPSPADTSPPDTSPADTARPAAEAPDSGRLPSPEDPPAPERPHHPEHERKHETDRACAALRAVAAVLREHGQLAGSPGREILDAQAMMAEDPGLIAAVDAAVAAGARAELALRQAFGRHRELLAAAGEHVASRVVDLDDVRDRAIAACSGQTLPDLPNPGHPFILMARDVSPADAARLDTRQVLAIVTIEGGPTSHTAILARALGVPAVVGCAAAASVPGGAVVEVDAAAGTVTRIAPEQATGDGPRLTSHGGGQAGRGRRSGHLPGRTADGHPVRLLANVGRLAEVDAAVTAGAEGVGLLRTEFLFEHADSPPTLAAQAAAYRAVLGAFAGVSHARVVARVLDIGADKPLPYVQLGPEPNPALGVRGLRVLRARQDLLDTQLRALAEAAEGAPGQLWVMAPMVADVAEAAWFRAQAARFGLDMAGVMIETPSAALTAPAVLAECDFASVGTNDLTQYTLAADRTLGALAPLQRADHPAVLALVATAVAGGVRTGKPVGVCGEAAADPAVAAILVGLGVTSLSMTPAALGPVRDALAKRTRQECEELARAALPVGWPWPPPATRP